jgi:phage-related protein
MRPCQFSASVCARSYLVLFSFSYLPDEYILANSNDGRKQKNACETKKVRGKVFFVFIPYKYIKGFTP